MEGKPMNSMTGYGYSEYSNSDYILTLEIKSYNNRYLDISFSCPSVLSPFEIEVTEKIKKAVSRGHLDVSYHLKTLKQDCKISVDPEMASSYIDAAIQVRDVCIKKGLSPEVKLSDILERDGVLTQVRMETEDTYKDAVFGCLDSALNSLITSRAREGQATKDNLKNLIDGISKNLDTVESHASELENQIKTNLTARIEEMLGDSGYDKNRILTEVAVMLMRYTINEEVVRLRTHIKEFNKLLESSEAVGKKLDFLCQEMNREINTIGSKSQIVEINLSVVEMKDSLENIREQIRNVE